MFYEVWFLIVMSVVSGCCFIGTIYNWTSSENYYYYTPAGIIALYFLGMIFAGAWFGANVGFLLGVIL